MAERYPERRYPVARVYGVAIDADQVLLVRAASTTRSPGAWWLPGGGIEYLEAPLDALHREVFEETGMTVVERELVDVMSDTYPFPDRLVGHFLRIIYKVRVEGELRHETEGSSDLAQWWPLAELDSLNLAQYARDAIARVRHTK